MFKIHGFGGRHFKGLEFRASGLKFKGVWKGRARGSVKKTENKKQSRAQASDFDIMREARGT